MEEIDVRAHVRKAANDSINHRNEAFEVLVYIGLKTIGSFWSIVFSVVVPNKI